MATLELGGRGRRATSSVASFRVEFVRDWSQAVRFRGDATSFQHRHWLDAWYGAFDTQAPLIAVISDTATQGHVALVPLICREQNGIRVVEFADLGVSDYN